MQKPPINIQVVIRILIGLLFIFSGGQKLISHYQNFLYVVQSYSFLPTTLERVVAFVVPWIEVILGVFMVLGLWLFWSLRGTLLLFVGFILLVSQAIIRKLPITECGCFGEWITFPLPVMLVFDSTIFLLLVFLILTIEKTRHMSLDEHTDSV